MKDKLKKIIGEILENQKIETSAPCRIDLGGTLDISTFNYPLRHLNPCTFNIAIGLRTRVKLFPYKNGFVKISSKGFKPVEYPSGKAPFNNELGLMFAIAEYFHADGVHILIDSESPTRSALGGSSVAAVALIGAFSKLYENLDQAPLSKKNIAHLAWQIESFVAGTTCGIQDMLAAAYGGVNAWYWRPFISDSIFVKKTIIKKKLFKELEECLLLAYCGIPHESLNINGKWMSRFCSGQLLNIRTGLSIQFLILT
jgi:D-glycero-alpha-D-manno-heptose-7-phosphate kinase